MSSLERRIIRFQFSDQNRSEFYESLGVLIDNNVLMLNALREMYAAVTDDGRRTKSARAIIIADILESLSGGASFAEAMSPWINPEEAAVIAAGEKAGQLRRAFRDAMDLVKHQRRISAAVKSMCIYPGVLGIAVIAVLLVISFVVVPKLTGVADPESWVGFAYALYQLSEAVVGYGIPLGLLSVLVIASVVWSLPRYTGEHRRILDKLPPWSLMRLISGATFLLNLSVMLKSGVKLQDSLLLLEAHANPWLKQRINGAIDGTEAGANLGVALADSGYDFPSRESIRYIRTLSSLDGFDRGLNDYAHTSLNQTITSVERASKVLLMAALSIIALLVLMVVGAISDIQSAIDASINR